jgi:hypothetical protein
VQEPALESEFLGADAPERRELVDALVLDRESCPLSEKKRRVDEVRLDAAITCCTLTMSVLTIVNRRTN